MNLTDLKPHQRAQVARDLEATWRKRKALGGVNLPSPPSDAPAPAQPPTRCLPKGGYSRPVVLAWFRDEQVPLPVFEHQFCAGRKWAFDLAWPEAKVALECQGGIWSQGRHTRGAALLKEWEKLNTAAEMGYRIIYCQPSDLLTLKTLTTIRRCLEYSNK